MSSNINSALEALKEGFEIYPVVDAVAGISVEAHEAGLRRWVQLICEFQRDWNRKVTVPRLTEILFAIEGH